MSQECQNVDTTVTNEYSLFHIEITKRKKILKEKKGEKWYLYIIMQLSFSGFCYCQAQSWNNGGTVEVYEPKEGEVPLCTIEKIAPCINNAITSYIRNTLGEEAARGPPDTVSSQRVGNVLSSDSFDPNTDLNATCE